MDSLIGPELRAAGITTEDELVLHTGTEMLEILDPEQFVDVVERLRRKGRGVTLWPGRESHHAPSDRDMEMLKLRLLARLTLEQTGERIGLSKERVRQRMAAVFGIRGGVRKK
jgi:DNA-directed RNA polymerase sigma subunit (sigma70/sigma32)